MENKPKKPALRLANIRRILKFMQIDPGPARKFVNWFIRHYDRLLEERQIRLTPAMVMLGEDICAHYILLARTNEFYARLIAPPPPPPQKADTPNEPPKTDTPAPPPLPDFKALSSVFDDVLKLRERLRKSVADFQSALEAAGVPPGNELDDLIAAGGFDVEDLIETNVDAPAHQTPGAPLTGIRPDMQAVQDIEPIKEPTHDDPPALEPEPRVETVAPVGRDLRPVPPVSDPAIARPVRRETPPRPVRQSLAAQALSNRVARIEGQTQGALLGSRCGQDHRDRDHLRLGVGMPAGPADDDCDPARGPSGPADAADTQHVRPQSPPGG